MINVNELYSAVQGEGKSAGREVVFLRTNGCNLACQWCDTPYTWNWVGTPFQHPEKFEVTKESHMMDIDDIVRDLEAKSNGRVRGLVVTGGEPMLWQKKLVLLFRELKKKDWWIEVETNGTIAPDDEIIELVDQFNCSPKLANAGPDCPLDKRMNAEALDKLARCYKATFKFVVTCWNDLIEVRGIISSFDIAPDDVYLMAEGKTKEEQEKNEGDAKMMANSNDWHFSPRLHILEFGNRRGV